MTCKDKCIKEAPIRGTPKHYPNATSKCTECQKRFDTKETYCYCCGLKLRKRKSRQNSIAKREMIKPLARY